MVRRKRQYIPKIKGCYECSQRRINCDRGHPSCVKCKDRGLICSGIAGKRIRFVQASTHAADLQQSRQPSIDNASPESTHHQQSLVITVERPSRALETLDGRTRYLLEHFSNKIASEMTVLDDTTNGWRRVLLPTAHTDDLVRLAVIAAAALHLQSSTNQDTASSTSAHEQALDRLRARQNLTTQSLPEQQGVLLALLVLLAASMIRGSTDFRLIFSLLDKAIAAVGGEENVCAGELGTFIVRQIRKYRGYVSPMLSQAAGIARLSKTSPTSAPSSSNGWEDFTTYTTRYARERSLAIMYDINTIACTIYVARAQRGYGTGRGFDAEVRQVRQKLEQLPEKCPCEHALVWPTFIAALESMDPDDRKFLVERLQRHYARNGFKNILIALEYLERRWADDGVEMDWTRSLPELGAFVV